MFHAALRLARPAALFAIAVLAAACVGSAGAGGPSPSSTPPPASSPTPSPLSEDPDTVIFRVTWEGGFVMPETLLARLPVVVVYADGRVITQGPVPAIFPGPFLPNLQEQTLSAEALERLVELARQKGLLTNAHYDFPGVADATDTVLEINLDGEHYRVSAYALAEAGFEGEVAPAIELDPADVEGRRALRAFVDALTGIPATDFVDAAHAYAFDALRLYVKPADIVENSEFPGEQPPIAWPLDDLATAGEAIDNPSVDRCLVVTGEDLGTVLPLLQNANQLSVFESNGTYYSLIPQPLLPGESGC